MHHLSDEHKADIRRLFEEFLLRRAKTIRSLRLAKLDVNPFLMRLAASQLGLSDGPSIVDWAVQQRLERGTVTAFGICLQNVAKTFSEGTGAEGADILKRKDGTRYYIQVKSGPNAIPKGLAEEISSKLQSAARRNMGAALLYGMCYGHKDRVSGIVRKYLTVNWKAGREFWEFVSGDAHCIDEIYEIAGQVGRDFKPFTGETSARYAKYVGKTLREILEMKRAELVEEFKAVYGESEESIWANLLQHNS